MQKFIRIMAIIAAALLGLSLFLLIATTPFQRMITKANYNAPDSFLGALPLFPLMPFLFTFLRLGCVALLIVCCGNKRGGIWLEVLVFAGLVFVIPAISTVVTPLYDQLLIHTKGEYYTAANHYVSLISNSCLIPANLGLPLAYATCGMSIVFKRMSKKLAVYEDANTAS